MNQQQMFGSALWITTPEDCTFPIIRGSFTVGDKASAQLTVVGLGWFVCYINGQRVGNDAFLPLSTDYESGHYPHDEIMTGHRLYCPQYDISDLLHPGQNTIALYFGGGWYTFRNGKYGDAKAIYRIALTDSEGSREICSGTDDKCGRGFISDYFLTTHECHNYTAFDDACLNAGFDDSAWPNAVPAKPVDTEYLTSSCPPDRVMRTLPLTRNAAGVYDCGENISGWPVLECPANSTVKVIFSEEILPDGSLNMTYSQNQRMEIVTGDQPRTVRPLFTWYAFRYFRIEGDALPTAVEVIHTDVAYASSFDSDNVTLNWLYRAYLNTQLCNMHSGIPSDCPHLERRGYTGDGQLACHAAMTLLDSREFYRKWIMDISDCQDTLTGHVQYTAPVLHSGGGPGGWGCAIIEVPYMYYLHYGDDEFLHTLYPQMLRYFDYLEAHSENMLITSDKKGEWCLGEWCTPIQVILPAPFVNNYFYVKSLGRMIEIARLTGHEEDIPLFEERMAARKQAIVAAYFNMWDGNFVGNVQGANAFAVDIGLGDDRTFAHLVEHYRKTGCYDTGIFGTDVVTRVLFERGEGQLAVDLLTSDKDISYEAIRRQGATTLWEYWTGRRSHSHPMFGAVAAYLSEYLLGIRRLSGTVGYRQLTIAPVLAEQINRISGSQIIDGRTVSVEYSKQDGRLELNVVLPEGISASACLEGREYPLSVGENRIVHLIGKENA